MNGQAMKAGRRPRVLLAEDDAVSRAFLCETLAGGAEVVAVEGAGAALRALRHGPVFALWLLDAHLAGADGIGLLRALRVHAPCTPALAHTADPDPALRRALLAAGFLEVLLKPMAPRVLRAAVLRATGRASAKVEEAAGPPWQPPLRELFLAELPAQREALHLALSRGELDTVLALLHRLRGSCALVGAHGLDAAVRALQAKPGSRSALDAFDRAVLAALRVQDAPEVGQQVP